jgi:hypothetical protein
MPANLPPGSYSVSVYVRSATTSSVDAQTSVSYVLSATAPATGVTLSPSAPSPLKVGTPLTFTAQGVGGVGTYQYKFYLNTGTGWQIVQNYSTQSTWTFTPTAPGTYYVTVYVRTSSTSNVDAQTGIMGTATP